LTLQDRLVAARARLIAAGITPDEAAVDVDLFARTILGWGRARLLTEHRAAEPPELQPRFSEWLARREAREPTAYIVGRREFWGLDFAVSAAVLIPRPCTELIVEEAVQRLKGAPAPIVADVGTGSGCIAVSIACTLPRARVIATDISPEALAVARDNAARHGVEGRVVFRHASFLDGADETFDLIAANPPYVKNTDKPALSPDVRHEPEVALFGGTTGLEAASRVIVAAVERLKPGGWLLMEFGYGQEDDIRALVGEWPQLRWETVREDIDGIARTAVVQKKEPG
jgi:release factor glutamine methyltransferase